MALSHPETNDLTHRIIGLAIEVHRVLGPGLLESVYEDCLYWELVERELGVARQTPLSIVYKSRVIVGALRPDLIVNDIVIVEVKSIEKTLPVHKSQLLTYMKLSRRPLGLLINFNVDRLIDGVTRLSL